MPGVHRRAPHRGRCLPAPRLSGLAIIPVAESAGVQMALHGDNPPISPLRGIGRVLTSAANFRRVLSIVLSPANGIPYEKPDPYSQ
jgi:hypothetical protein